LCQLFTFLFVQKKKKRKKHQQKPPTTLTEQQGKINTINQPHVSGSIAIKKKNQLE
jgi:hypothetical protein